jgi:hypothetical protein
MTRLTTASKKIPRPSPRDGPEADHGLVQAFNDERTLPPYALPAPPSADASMP